MGDEAEQPLDGRGLNIAHLNMGSMLGIAKFEMLKQQLRESTLSIFGVSETWLKEGVPVALVTVPGYSMVRYDRKL